ncbi:MAG: hypothetical protein JJU36_01805 [Phycisphaeraceae bacterium]|nr:hypothetical protein [Phycisphaeraceae bacterium]
MRNSIWIITPITIIILGLVLMLMWRGNPDKPTQRTSAQNLRLSELAPLDPLFPTPYRPGSASDTYRELIDAFSQGVNPPQAAIDEHLKTLVDAMSLQDVRQGYLDELVPLSPLPDAPALRGMGELVTQVVQKSLAMYQRNQQREAIELARAGFVFTYRAYHNNHRLLIRDIALEQMAVMCRQIQMLARQLDPSTANLAERWEQVINSHRERWAPKLDQVLRRMRPNVADVIRIAERDEDSSFRQEAVLTLARLKFQQENHANVRQIQAAIDRLLKSSDPMIREAAEVADRFTRDDFRRMRTM